MNKRFFLKLISLASFGAFVPIQASALHPKPRHYITECKVDDLIGVRCEWPNLECWANPVPGSDWEITEECPNHFVWNGVDLNNFRRDKFYAVAVQDRSKIQLCCFDRIKDHTAFDLSHSKAYLP